MSEWEEALKRKKERDVEFLQRQEINILDNDSLEEFCNKIHSFWECMDRIASVNIPTKKRLCCVGILKALDSCIPNILLLKELNKEKECQTK